MLCLILGLLLALTSSFAYAEDDEFWEFEDDELWEFEDGEFLSFEDDGFLEFEDDDTGFSSVSSDGEAEDIEYVPYDYDDIVIGNPTPLKGDFFTGLWGNATSDIDVRYLVAGYNLITWDSEISIFRFDRSVVNGAVVTGDSEGNRMYLLSLYSDLYYSDGTPITAYDYAFSVLLQSSAVISELGGHPAVYDYLVGYEDYAAGNTPCFSGVRVLSDSLILFTVKQEALPYFYELSYLAFYPYPIHAIAPGCAVYDDGNGVYIGNEDPSADEPCFTADTLRASITDPERGYRSHPDPVSGPYRIISFDGTKAVFEINPYYKGNEAGKKPRINRLTYMEASNDTMIQDLSEGKFALLNKVAFSDSIMKGLQLCMGNGQYTRSTYPRIGLTYILFNPDSTPVQELNVRKAIAYCLDKEQFISSYVGAFGLEVDGLYGLGQWMTNAATGALPYPLDPPENATKQEEEEYEKTVEAWDQLSLDQLIRYEVDVDAAIALLDQAGWTLNEQGGAYDPQKDQVRCKEINGQLCRLELTMGYRPNSDVEQKFNDYFVANLNSAGIRLTLEPLTFEQVVDAHVDRQAEELDMYYLGDNFNISFDPSLFFPNAADEQTSGTKKNSMNAVYRELDALARDMAATEQDDILAYVQKWLLFQERLSDDLPLIPVYTNIYFDFYTKELDEYWIEEHSSWAEAIVSARMRSLKSTDQDVADLEIELSFAEGSQELDVAALIGRPVHEAADYSGGALALFPEDIRSQIPEGFNTIYEFVAGEFNMEIEEDVSTIEMKYSFQTPYWEGETVYVLYGIPGKGSNVDWFVVEGTGLENGDVAVILEQEQWERLIGITFAIAVVSQ